MKWFNILILNHFLTELTKLYHDTVTLIKITYTMIEAFAGCPPLLVYWFTCLFCVIFTVLHVCLYCRNTNSPACVCALWKNANHLPKDKKYVLKSVFCIIMCKWDITWNDRSLSIVTQYRNLNIYQIVYVCRWYLIYDFVLWWEVLISALRKAYFQQVLPTLFHFFWIFDNNIMLTFAEFWKHFNL